MRKSILIRLLFVLCPFILSSQSIDNINANKWLKEKFAKGSIPPFSFVYNGISSDSIITSWD